MIEINLLPKELQEADATPLPRFIAICAGVLLVAGLAAGNLYLMRQQKKAEEKLADRSNVLVEKKAEAEQVDVLEAKIKEINEHVDVIKGLYKKRTIWAKLLYDMKKIVTFDPTVDQSNEAERYLWLYKLSHKPGRSADKMLTLEGFSSFGGYQTESVEFVQQMLRFMIDFQAKSGPEKEMTKKLQEEVKTLEEELRKAAELRRKLRKSNPSLPKETREMKAKREEVEAKQKEMAELEKEASGRVALKAFHKWFEAGTIHLVNSELADTPSLPDDLKEAENVPESLQKFKITMKFKPLEEKPAGPKRPGAR